MTNTTLGARLRTRSGTAVAIVQEAERFLGDEVLAVNTIGTSPGGVAPNAPNGARHAYIQNRSDTDVYARPKDGSLGGTPDITSQGFLIPATGAFDYTGDPGLLLYVTSVDGKNLYIMYFGD